MKKQRSKSLAYFIRLHRSEIDQSIAHSLKMTRNPRAYDAERRLWVLNDEALYLWARQEGVRDI